MWGGSYNITSKRTRMTIERMGPLLILVDFLLQDPSVIFWEDFFFVRLALTQDVPIPTVATPDVPGAWANSHGIRLADGSDMDLCPWIHRPCADEVPKVCLFAMGWMPPNFGGTWMASICQQSLDLVSHSRGVDFRLQSSMVQVKCRDKGENRWRNSQTWF